MPTDIDVLDLVQRYVGGADLPAGALEGLSDADLDARPVPGTWSIREIIVHLYDSDVVGIDRMKRVIAMDTPLLLAYDQDRFAQRLGYGEVDARAAALAFAANRRLMGVVLSSIPAEAYGRAGVHSENGKVTLAELVNVYVEHVEHHLRFVRRKRELLGRK